MAGFRSSATGLCWSNTWWKKTAATTSARSATMWARTSASPCTSQSKVRRKNALFYLLAFWGLKSSVVSIHICLKTKWRQKRWLDTAGLMCGWAKNTVGVDSKNPAHFPLESGLGATCLSPFESRGHWYRIWTTQQGAHLCLEHPHVYPVGFVVEKPNMWSQMCSFQSFVFIHLIICEMVCS